VNCKLITAGHYSCEPDSCAVWVSYLQKLSLQESNHLIGIEPTSGFSWNIWFLIPKVTQIMSPWENVLLWKLDSIHVFTRFESSCNQWLQTRVRVIFTKSPNISFSRPTDLGLGRPEARLKRGPSDDVVIPRKRICGPWCYTLPSVALGVMDRGWGRLILVLKFRIVVSFSVSFPANLAGYLWRALCVCKGLPVFNDVWTQQNTWELIAVDMFYQGPLFRSRPHNIKRRFVLRLRGGMGRWQSSFQSIP